MLYVTTNFGKNKFALYNLLSTCIIFSESCRQQTRHRTVVQPFKSIHFHKVTIIAY